MHPKGGRKAPGKKIVRRTVPRETEPDQDSSSSHSDHEEEHGGHP